MTPLPHIGKQWSFSAMRATSIPPLMTFTSSLLMHEDRTQTNSHAHANINFFLSALHNVDSQINRTRYCIQGELPNNVHTWDLPFCPLVVECVHNKSSFRLYFVMRFALFWSVCYQSFHVILNVPRLVQ